jgi:4-diphosphocytidyl-2-C-methyl-D-erythritol kinase
MNPSCRVAVRCPAKVNLSLRVLGLRPDGYHEIDTVFQAIGLWDELEAEAAPTFSLSCDEPGVPTDATNLVLRAARALADAAGVRGEGAAFRLRKSIPAGAGLGGGSSDAAGALVALAALWGLPGDASGLAAVAAQVGSDVPFFLYGGTAHGTGRGERITPLPFAGDLAFLVATPPFEISTTEVYRRFATRLTPLGDGVRVPPLLTLKLAVGKDFGLGVNDLETVVLEGWPELIPLRAAMQGEGAAVVLVSGSGSSIVGLFESDARRASAAATLRGRFPRWRLAMADGVPTGVQQRGGD